MQNGWCLHDFLFNKMRARKSKNKLVIHLFSFLSVSSALMFHLAQPVVPPGPSLPAGCLETLGQTRYDVVAAGRSKHESHDSARRAKGQ